MVIWKKKELINMKDYIKRIKFRYQMFKLRRVEFKFIKNETKSLRYCVYIMTLQWIPQNDTQISRLKRAIESYENGIKKLDEYFVSAAKKNLERGIEILDE